MPYITPAQISAILPECADPNGWSNALNVTFPKFNITNNLEIAAFIGQCATESGQFNEIIENLNYSAQALMLVYPREFPNITIATEYARQPEAIANIVYAPPRNGNTQVGDGWYLRGRGLIQITGRTNYQAFATALNMLFDDAVAYATTQQGAADCAGWYWSANNLNRFCTANTNDFISLTEAINGSTTGLQTREQFWSIAKQVLGV